MFRHWPGTVLVPVLACCHGAKSHCLNQCQQIIRKSFGQFQCSKCSRYLFLIWYKIINSSLQLHITGLNGLSYCVACGICILYRTISFYQNFSGMWWRIITNLAISASEKCSHIVYLLNVQIVIMSTMLNVSMQTEIMLYPVLCGTVCIVCKLYFHLTTLKTTRNFFQWSWNVSLIILFNFMKWTPKCSFHLKLMKAPTSHSMKWIQIFNFTQVHIML